MQKRILLVDDESSIRRTLSLSLTQQGYDIEPCENGFNALKKLDLYKKNNIYLDGVVIDIKLPDIDGIRLGKIIKAKYPDTSIIFITGYADKIDLQEIDNISISGILEKPFTAKDLTYRIEEVLNKKNVTRQTILNEDKKVVKSASAYMLLKLDANADFFEIYKKLYFMKDILYCDTTKGDYDIFLLIQHESQEKCIEIYKNIKKMEGVKEVDFLEIATPILDENIRNIIQIAEDALSGSSTEYGKARDLSKSVCSYILLEIEREKLDKIYPVLQLNENVVYCDYTMGKYNIVLFVHGNYFGEIDKFIEEKIVSLEGVLRVKEFPVVNLFDM